MALSVHDLRLNFLAWVQSQSIYRRGMDGLGDLVSDNEAVEELITCTQASLQLPDYRFADLNEVERLQVETVVSELLRCGAYHGSKTDAITDSVAIVKAVMFAE